MRYQIPPGGPQSGPIARFLGAVIGLFIMIGLFFLGITVFAFAAGIALVAFLVFYARFWWLTRKARRRYADAEQQAGHGRPGFRGQDPGGQDAGGQGKATGRRDRQGVTLDGEYEERD